MTNTPDFPDFRALSADLLVAIQLYTGLRHPAASEMSSVEITGKLMDAMAATAAALATPPPELPTVAMGDITPDDLAYAEGFLAGCSYAASATPPPEPPTDEELLRKYGVAKRDFCYEGPIDDWPKRAERAATIYGLRAVLERWGK